MVSESIRRVALLHLAEDEAEESSYQDWLKEQPLSEVVHPISERVLTRLRFRLGPNALVFFDLYERTRAMMDGAPSPEGGLVMAWKAATRVLARALATKLGDRRGPEIINTLYDRMTTVYPLLRKIEGGLGIPSFRTAGGQLAEIISDVCRAVEVPVSTRPGLDAAKWPLIRRATTKEQQLDELRIRNPALYAQMTENREKLRQREIAIRENISRAGMLPEKRNIRGQVVNIGIDPVTNEQRVFANDGRVLSVQQFSRELLRNREAEAKSRRIFPNGLPKDGDISLEGIRKLSAEDLRDPKVIPPNQDLSYAALTDDLSPEEGTRIYPTMKDAKGRSVCVAGRFTGVYMEDLVNRTGRLIEGVAYDFDANGKRIRFETKKSDGSPNITVRKEPYVTVLDDGRFMIKLPLKKRSGADPFTPIRQELDRLGRPTVIPTIEKVPETMGTTFTFHAKDFSAVRRAVGGMILSKGAADALQSHFDQIARQERALGEEATKNFSLARIGGFRVREKIDPATGGPVEPVEFEPDLFLKQKQAISWIESRGYSGLVALDTGIGKTLTCIATMKKMERDGFASEETRFLYVCPTKLRGNFSRQARAWLEDAGALLDRVDVLTYEGFAKKLRENPNFGSIEGDPASGIPPYAAVFFDEAQVLVKNYRSKASIAAQSLKHPRKILLTASPMEESPDELYVGVAITNNVNLNTPGEEGKIAPAILDLRRFRDRFCRTVGGRTLGLKPSDATDPTKTEDFYAWAKAHFFAANKRDVIENPLPELRKETKTLEMDPEVEKVYRDTSKKIVATMKAAFTAYRNQGKVRGEEVKELFGLRLKKYLSTLNNLANMPSVVIPGTRSPKVEAAIEAVRERVARRVRTLLFTDTPDFALYTATELSAKVPSLLHGVALSGKILVLRNGKVVATYTPRQYVSKDGQEIAKTEWASFVLGEVLGEDPEVVSLTLTSTYTLGQNLQMFSTVIHLDRDSFSSEMMKQRTARSWRTGQNSAVDEITLDVAYGDIRSTSDATLDELRRVIQDVQESLFNEIVGKSQSAAVGKEWSEMGNVDASLVAVNRKLLERVLAPLPAFMGEQEASR